MINEKIKPNEVLQFLLFIKILLFNILVILKPENKLKLSWTVRLFSYCLLVYLISIKMLLIYELTGISAAQDLYIINCAVKWTNECSSAHFNCYLLVHL